MTCVVFTTSNLGEGESMFLNAAAIAEANSCKLRPIPAELKTVPAPWFSE